MYDISKQGHDQVFAIWSTGGDTTRGSGVTSSVDFHGGSSDDRGEGKSSAVGDGVGHKAEISLSDIMHELRALRRGQTEIEAKIERVTESVAQSFETIGGGRKPVTHTHTSSTEEQAYRSALTSKANAGTNPAVRAVQTAADHSVNETFEPVFWHHAPEDSQTRPSSRSKLLSVSRTLSQLIEEDRALKYKVVDAPSRTIRPTHLVLVLFHISMHQCQARRCSFDALAMHCS